MVGVRGMGRGKICGGGKRGSGNGLYNSRRVGFRGKFSEGRRGEVGGKRGTLE